MLSGGRGTCGLERAHLDRVVAGRRVCGGELDGLLAVSAADDVDAGDELPGLDERPVAEQCLPVADAERRGRVGAFQRPAQDVQAACLQVLTPGFSLPRYRPITGRHR